MCIRDSTSCVSLGRFPNLSEFKGPTLGRSSAAFERSSVEGTWLIGQQPWAARLQPGPWALLLSKGHSHSVPQFLSPRKVGVEQPLSTSPSEKSAQAHIPLKGIPHGFVGLRFKTSPSIPLLAMNCSEGIGFLSATDLSLSLLDGWG